MDEHIAVEKRLASLENWVSAEFGGSDDQGRVTKGHVRMQLLALRTDVDRLNNILDGNGKIGLSAKVEIIWRTYIGIVAMGAGAIGTILGAVLMKFAGGS